MQSRNSSPTDVLCSGYVKLSDRDISTAVDELPHGPLTGLGRKQRLAESIDRVGLTGVLKRMHDRGRNPVTVLAYHRIAPLKSADPRPLDLDLVSATPPAFDWQMSYLRGCMNPVSLTQVIRNLEDGKALPRNAVVVTFDDGFVDTHEYAFPILRKHAIPATIFITTGNTLSGDPFWFELAAHLMSRLEPGSVLLDELDKSLPTGPSTLARRQSLRLLNDTLKSLTHARHTEIIRDWMLRHASAIDRSAADVGWPMTSSQMVEMSAAGIEFGSHTVTHPNLSRLSGPEQLWELTESRRTLEQLLQREISLFAYPFGTADSYDSNVIRHVQQAGFKLAVSYRSGVNWTETIELFDVRRIGVGLSTSPAQFRVQTSLAGWLGQ